MSSGWKLNGTPVEQFGEVEWELRNQSAGRLVITRFANPDAAPVWDYGETVLLTDGGGNVHFRGKVVEPRGGGETAQRRAQTIVVNDAWKRLETLTYETDWPFDTSENTDTRVVIGGKIVEVEVSDEDADPPESETLLDLVPTDVAETLADALEFAGYSSAQRDIGITGKIPPVEADAISVAGIIRAVMRYFPGSVGWIDPATGKVHLKKASALETRSLAITDCRSFETPRLRQELAVPGVTLILRKERKSNEGGRWTQTRYTAGDPGADGAIVLPVELLPEVHALEVVNWRIEQLTEEIIEDIDWWAARIPWIKYIQDNPEEYTISGFTAGGEGGIPWRVALTPTILPYAITAGSGLPESFVLKGCSGPKGPRAEFITSDNALKPSFGDVQVNAVIAFRRVGTTQDQKQALSLTFKSTTLSQSGRYAWEDPLAFDPGENPADFAGLPAQILAEASRLLYEGSVTFVTDEPASSWMGKALSLTGGAEEWAAMAAPIHTVRQRLSTGETTLEYGAPSYLGARDWVDLFRAKRHKRPQRRRTTKLGLPPQLTPSFSDQSASTGRSTPPPAPIEQTGSLKITLGPEEAVAAGARWFATIRTRTGENVTIGPNPSDVATEVPLGTAKAIWFDTLDGWTPPATIENFTISGTHTIGGSAAEYQRAAPPVTPWRFEVRKDPATEDWEGAVHSEGSTLMGVGLDPSNLLVVAGLDVWQPVSAGDVAYLEGDVANGTWEVIIGEPWDPAFPPYEFDESDPPEVAFIYKLLGRVVEDGAGGLKAIPCVTTGLRLETMHDNGTYLDYPVGDSGGIEVDA